MAERRAEVLHFLDYATGAAGRKIIESLGMLPAKSEKAKAKAGGL